MKIINKTTGKVIATITTSHSMTLGEACALMGIDFIVEETGHYPENGHYFEELELVH